MQERYGAEVARVICELTGWPEVLDVQAGGVFVKEEYLVQDPGEDAFTWSPACDMDWAGAPDPLTAPSLPIPFTASELAAFMLNGPGSGIQYRYGCIDDGPDEEEMAKLGKRATKVCKVLREAYDLARQAQYIVGKLDIEGQQRAHDLLDQFDEANDQAMEREKVRERLIIGKKKDGSPEYGDPIPRDEYLLRLARAKEAVAALDAQALQANAEADAKQVTWCKSMVRQLLRPEESCSPALQSYDAQPQGTTPIPEPVAAGNGPAKQANALKKNALIAELEYEWSSIEADISDATRNGLKAAAHTGKHGEWDKDKARAWAVTKGKIKRDASIHSLAGAWPRAVTRNTIGDR